ncbi:MAG: hypothetical protein QOH71_761 [Blastocatellia bacterium]|jgi:hypothetical protein|nr:hypothetical protein [Blastocatellia bacterium]
MTHNILNRFLIVVALLILAVPVAVSAQTYRERSSDRYNNRGQYDRMNRRDARDAIARLENSSARLESDLNVTPGRRVLGIFQLKNVDSSSVAQVRDFRRAVRQLRNNGSIDEAQRVLDQGVQLDRYLRLRTGSTRVDADLSDLRSDLHILAEAYGLTMPYQARLR